jgi:hypothetical protein
MSGVRLSIPFYVIIFALPSHAVAQESPADSSAILFHAGMGAYQRGDSAEWSLQLFRQSLAQARDSKDRRREGPVLNAIGMIYRELDAPDSALVYFTLACTIARDVGDPSGRAATLANIGWIHLDRGQADSALFYQRWATRHPYQDR